MAYTYIVCRTEVGIYKRKQENRNSTKKAIKKTRKQELDQESDQENKKIRKKTRTRPRKRPRKKEKKNLFFLITSLVGFLVESVFSFIFLPSCFLLYILTSAPILDRL